jgi:hypothetical protein
LSWKTQKSTVVVILFYEECSGYHQGWVVYRETSHLTHIPAVVHHKQTTTTHVEEETIKLGLSVRKEQGQ